MFCFLFAHLKISKNFLESSLVLYLAENTLLHISDEIDSMVWWCLLSMVSSSQAWASISGSLIVRERHLVMSFVCKEVLVSLNFDFTSTELVLEAWSFYSPVI